MTEAPSDGHGSAKKDGGTATLCRKKLSELKRGDMFRTVLGDEGNAVTFTLLDAKTIGEYPGLRLTVRRADGRENEIIYGRPFAAVIKEREMQ